jgi:ABC-type uncharacterized transport system auxiliary subunit
MTIFNKRNAMIGWATWLVGKKVFRSRNAARGHRKRSIVAAAAAGLATVGGAVLFWRKRKGNEGQPTGA